MILSSLVQFLTRLLQRTIEQGLFQDYFDCQLSELGSELTKHERDHGDGVKHAAVPGDLSRLTREQAGVVYAR